MKKMKKILSLLLCVVMLVGMFPVSAFAAAEDGICEHHLEHTADCGYAEGSEGSPCTHAHVEGCYKLIQCVQGHADAAECTVESGCVTMSLACQHTHSADCGYSEGTAEVPCGHSHDGDCGYVASVEGKDCAHSCADHGCTLNEDGETYTCLHAEHDEVCGYVAPIEGVACNHTEHTDCGYAPATEGTACNHTHSLVVGGGCYAPICAHAQGQHDETCGYVAAVAASACTFHCDICHEDETVPPAPETPAPTEAPAEEPVCTCDTEDPAYHAPFCALYVRTGDACLCEVKCTEENHNIYCEVCYFDGIAACTDGEENQVPYTTTGSCGDNATYTLTDDGTLTISGSGAINDEVFKDNTEIVTVVIESGVTIIGNNAFENCSSLTSVTIPDSVTHISGSAFENCSSLTSVTIGNSVKYIGYNAFENCSSLTSVTIPNSVTHIYGSAFQNCSSLTSVTIGNSVTSIGDEAFYKCISLTSVDIPDSVTEIGSSAFERCSGLTSVTIGNSVTSIGGSAFDGCSGLTSVVIPNSVTEIGYSAFDDCSSLTSVTIGNSVTSIGNVAFGGCSSLTSVVIPDSVTEIGYSAFDDCSSLTSVTIGNSVTKIGNNTFYNCSSLASVVIPDSVTSIGGSAFYNCSGLTSVTIGNSVTSIGYEAFQYCSLTSVTIPDSVTSIGSHAFQYCRSLTSVTIGNSVTSIGYDAFYACNKLLSVTAPCKCTVSGKELYNGTTLLYDFSSNSKVKISLAEHKPVDTGSCICGYNPIESVTVTGDKTSWLYATDATATLTATIVPTNLSNASYVWKAGGETVPNETSSTLSLTGLNVGDHTYTCTVTVDGYKKTSDAFKISVIAAPTPVDNLTYTGVAQSLLTADTASGIEIQYAIGDSATAPADGWSTAIPTATDAGSYAVWYKLAGDANHNDAAARCVIATIAQRSITITAKDQTITYGSGLTEKDVTVDKLASGEALDSVTLTPSTTNVTDKGTITPSAALIKNGDKDVTANYAITYTSGKLTITKAESRIISAPHPVPSLTYSSEEHALVTAGTATGGTLQYALSNDSSAAPTDGWSEEIPSAANAGTYYVWYKVKGDSNHNDTEADWVTVSIAKADASDSMKTASGTLYKNGTSTVELPTLPYSNMAHNNPTFTTPVISAVVNDGSLIVKGSAEVVKDGSYTVTIPVDGGDNYNNYTITVTLTGMEHEHDWSYSVNGTTITASCGNADTCPDAEQSFTLHATDAVYSGNPVEAEVTWDGVEPTYTLRYTGSNYDSPDAPTNAGDYTVTMTVGDKSVSDTFTISRKNITNCSVRFRSNSFTYSGSAPDMNISVVDESVGSKTLTAGVDYELGAMQKDAGDHTLTVTGIGNYTGSVELPYVIKKAEVYFLIAGDATKEYDGTADCSNALEFDSVLPSGLSAEYDAQYIDSNGPVSAAGRNYDILIDNIRLSGENAGNYVLRCYDDPDLDPNEPDFFLITTGHILPREITVTPTMHLRKTYGDPDPELSYTVSGLLPGDSLEGALSREEGENVGSYAITLGTLDNPNYAITLVPANFLIEKREITISGITAETREYDGTTNATIDINTLDPVFSNVPAGESFYMSVYSATYADPDASENKSATPGSHYIYVTDGYDINNYEFVFAPITGTVTPRPITVTANNVSKTYGEADPNLTYGVTEGRMVDSDTFTGELSRVEGENVGEYDITIGTLANPNYDITFVPGKLTINKAASSISFVGYAPDKTYDGTALAVPAETELNISGALYTDVTYTWYKDSVSEANRLNAAPKDAGSYVLVATIPDSSNTSSSSAESGLITISPAPVTVTPTDMQKVYLDPDRVIEYTAEGLIPGETLSGALSREAGEELGPYDVTIGTLQSENPNYNITLKPGVVTIKPRVIYVRGVSAEDKVYDETTHATLKLQAVELGNLPEAYPDAITALELMGIFYTADAGEDKYVDVSLVDFTVSEGLDKDGFIFSVSDTSADITPLPIEITVYQSSKYYSDAEPGEFSYSVEPYVSLALEISRETGEDVGEYDFILETELKNHAASFANSFLIERKPIDTIVYSAAIYNGEYTGEEIDGLLEFEFEGGLVEGTDYTVSGNIRTAVGTHTVTFTGIGNYCDEQTLSFEIWPPSTIRDVLDGTVTPETVMPEDYEELKLLEDALATIDEDTEHEDLDQWKHAAEKLAPIIDALEELEALVNSENIKAAEDIDADNVTVNDKETLEAAKADIEKLLDEYSGKLDAGTVAELEDKLETIEETLDTLEDAESIISEIEKWLKDNKDKFDADELKLREEYKDIMDDIDALNANAQRIVKDAVGDGLKAAEAKLYTYKIISGDGANWVRGSGATLDFTANGAVSLFDHLLVDGKKLDAANYTVSSGSTIVKLKADYLQALVPGRHNIQFVYTDGSTNVVEFIVGYTISGTVQTGDSSNPALWLSLMLSSLAAIMVSLPRLKRRKEEN